MKKSSRALNRAGEVRVRASGAGRMGTVARARTRSTRIPFSTNKGATETARAKPFLRYRIGPVALLADSCAHEKLCQEVRAKFLMQSSAPILGFP